MYPSKASCHRARWGATCRYLRQQSKFEEAISSILLLGGDTDTNAAIVGGLVGALHGAAAIPEAMRAPVLSRNVHSLGIPRPDFLATQALPTLCQQLFEAAPTSPDHQP